MFIDFFLVKNDFFKHHFYFKRFIENLDFFCQLKFYKKAK